MGRLRIPPHLWSVSVLALALPASLGFSLATPPKGARVKDTKVTARGKATLSVVPPPNAASENVTLTEYMRLPVEQYALIPMPMGSSLTRRAEEEVVPSSTLGDATEFELVVPSITFFQLSLQPVVYATVRPREDRVEILSETCVLRGSPFIEQVNLNERFDICVNTTLTWEDPLSRASSAQGVARRGYRRGVADRNFPSCSITAETRINVDVDVPRPFSSIPKVISQRTGNAALKLSLKLIQGTFVDNLVKDYTKWANELEYRNYRASLSANGAVDDLLVGTGHPV